MLRLSALVLAAGLASVGLGACGVQFGAPDAASEQGAEISSLYRGTMLAALAVGALVWGLIAWSLLRYRRGKRPIEDIGSQRGLHVPLEVLYTVLPIVIVAVLFFFSLRTQNEVTELDPDPDVTVEVIGFQWQWQFRYPDDDVTVTGASVGAPPELVLPVGQTSRLRLVSNDVNHSFWVPRFLSKRDLIPGVRNEIDVTPTKTGSFVGRCAEFCGLDHWRMNFTVRVVSAAEYEAWLAQQQGSGEEGP